MRAAGKIRNRLLAVMVGAAVAAGCGEGPLESPPGAEPLAGRYLLEAADDLALPATVFDGRVDDGEGGFHLRLEVVAGSLEVRADGHYEQRLVVRSLSDGVPDPAGPAIWVDRGRVTGAGESLRFGSEWIENVEFAGAHRERTLLTSQELLRHFVEQPGLTRFRFRR